MHLNDMKWPWTHKTIKNLDEVPGEYRKEIYTDNSWQIFDPTGRCIGRCAPSTPEQDAAWKKEQAYTCEICGGYAPNGLSFCNPCNNKYPEY